MSDPFRVYAPEECGTELHGPRSYPFAWHDLGDGRGVKHLVREAAGDRCERCGHPYLAKSGEWSPCDLHCTHGGPWRFRFGGRADWQIPTAHANGPPSNLLVKGAYVEAAWRILTVHHLTGEKADCRWWNLAALCQRCHLLIQRKVVMDRPWPWPHTGWFAPHAAGWYALRYAGLELGRDEVLERLEELLEIGAQEESVERMRL